MRAWNRCVWLRAGSVKTAMNLLCQKIRAVTDMVCKYFLLNRNSVSRDFVSTGLNRWITIWKARWCARQLVHPVSIIWDCPVWTPAQPTDNNRALFICARRHFGSQRWKFSVFLWRPQWARASSFTRFLDRTQRRATVGRTPPDEWSARRSWKFFSKTKWNHFLANGCGLINSTSSKCDVCMYTTLCTCKRWNNTQLFQQKPDSGSLQKTQTHTFHVYLSSGVPIKPWPNFLPSVPVIQFAEPCTNYLHSVILSTTAALWTALTVYHTVWR
jgi:hypothetical protein